jgi:DNA-directed RNA polymerase specialized sigma24 family protein
VSFMPDEVTPADIERFRAAVHQKCPWFMSYDDREDVVGDILVAAVAASKTTGIPIVNLAFAHLKRRRYFERPAQRLARHRSELVEAEAEVENRLSTVAIAEAQTHDTRLEVEDLIDRLPLDEKHAFVLVERWGYTVPHAAEALRISLSTAHRRLSRARGRVGGGWLMAQAV